KPKKSTERRAALFALQYTASHCTALHCTATAPHCSLALLGSVPSFPSLPSLSLRSLPSFLPHCRLLPSLLPVPRCLLCFRLRSALLCWTALLCSSGFLTPPPRILHSASHLFHALSFVLYLLSRVLCLPVCLLWCGCTSSVA